VKVDEDGVVKMPSRRSLLGLAWAVLGDEVRLPAAVPAVEEKESLPAGELRRLAPDFVMPVVPDSKDWKSPEEGVESEAPPFDWAKEKARHAGIVVHAWLQRIAEDELRGWDAKRVDSLSSQFSKDLQRRGVAPADLDAAAGLVAAALKNALSDERGRWALGPHPVSRTEHRLRNRERSFRIDRYFEDAKGKKWVVDYKTSVHEGAGVEVFLDLQQERYAAQLDAYAQALGADGRGLYFPLQKGWREW
jgi:hypothetical protein